MKVECRFWTFVVLLTLVKKGSSNGLPVFFDRYICFYWWRDKGERKQKTIGDLAKGSWYKFSH